MLKNNVTPLVTKYQDLKLNKMTSWKLSNSRLYEPPKYEMLFSLNMFKMI